MTFEDYKSMVVSAAKNTQRLVPKDFDSGFVRYNKYKSTIMRLKVLEANIRIMSSKLEHVVLKAGLNPKKFDFSGDGGVFIRGTDMMHDAIVEQIHHYNDDIMYSTTQSDALLLAQLQHVTDSLEAHIRVMYTVMNMIVGNNFIKPEFNYDKVSGICSRVEDNKAFIVKMTGPGKMTEADVLNDAINMTNIMDQDTKCKNISEFKKWLMEMAVKADAFPSNSNAKCSDIINLMNNVCWEDAFNLYIARYDALNMLVSYITMISNKYESIKLEATNDPLINSANILFESEFMTYVISSVWFLGSSSDDTDMYRRGTFDLEYVHTLTDAYVRMSNIYGAAAFRTTFRTSDDRVIDTTGLPKKAVDLMKVMLKENPDMDIDECRNMAIDAYNNDIDE